MPASRRAVTLLGLVVAISAVWLAAGDKKTKPSKNATAGTPAPMDDDKRIAHALNRFTFGVRPGDVERVRALGLDKWFDQQLHPEKIDDSAAEARLAPFRTLKMSTREMVENFPPNPILKAVQDGKMGMPSDPAKRAIYQSRILAMQENQQKKQDAGANNNAANSGPDMKDMKSDSDMKADPDAKMDNSDDSQLTPEQRQQRLKQREDAMYADLGPDHSPRSNQNPPAARNSDTQMAQRRQAAMYADLAADKLLQMPPDDRYKSIMKMSPQERLDLAQQYRGPRAMQLVDGMRPEQRETIEAMMNPQLVVGGELSEAKVLRSIYSERQLEEVMTDFWYNHFNIFIGKGPDRYMITAYERDVIRPHVLGKFKDLLVATAKSPAMLFYLDNWESVGPNSELALYGNQRRQFRRGPFGGIYQMPPRPQANKNRPSGLNENYAREIMELHTLGVDGGYTQKDVTELAKVLTGWSIDQPQRGGGFRFNDRAHEPGPKFIFGQRISEHGEQEGMEMLDILAHHPSTAKFISRKLAMRFVSDNPPQSLIDRMADTFQKKDGDIREVLHTLFTSPEFWSTDAYRAKVKTPLEFVASSARASGVDVRNALPLVQFLNRMGMPLYGMQPPTGYSMKGATWVNSAALLTRMNFALALGTGKLPGTILDPQTLLHGQTAQDADAALAVLENGMLAGDVSAQTHAVMEKQLNDPQVSQRRLDDAGRAPNYGAIAGLIMGSPEFQRR